MGHETCPAASTDASGGTIFRMPKSTVRKTRAVAQAQLPRLVKTIQRNASASTNTDERKKRR